MVKKDSLDDFKMTHDDIIAIQKRNAELERDNKKLSAENVRVVEMNKILSGSAIRDDLNEAQQIELMAILNTTKGKQTIQEKIVAHIAVLKRMMAKNRTELEHLKKHGLRPNNVIDYEPEVKFLTAKLEEKSTRGFL